MQIKVFTVNPFGVNAFILWNKNGDGILIDPSVSSTAEQEKLKQFIRENNITVRRVVNTHLHLDHVLGNAFVERTFGVKAEAHEEDIFLLDLQEEQSEMYGLPCDEPAPAIEDFLAEGDTIRIGDRDDEIAMQVLHIAGHSPGGIALYCEKPGNVIFNGQDAGSTPPLLFSGDILFAGGRGRSDLFGGDDDALVSGIKSKLLTLPKETIVFPGHGGFTTIEEETGNFQ